MPTRKVYRTLQPGEPRSPHLVRVRVPVAKYADHRRPKAGYRRANATCSVTVVLVEVDCTTLLRTRERPT